MDNEKLCKLIDELLDKILKETSVTGGEGYLGKYSFLPPGGEKKNAKYLTKKFGYSFPKKPKNLKTFDIVKFNEIKGTVEKELLNEISYRRFAEDVSKITPERKISRALNEIRKRITEINQVIEYSQRLKNENAVKKESFWPSKSDHLESLAEMLSQLSSKIRNLNK